MKYILNNYNCDELIFMKNNKGQTVIEVHDDNDKCSKLIRDYVERKNLKASYDNSEVAADQLLKELEEEEEKEAERKSKKKNKKKKKKNQDGEHLVE